MEKQIKVKTYKVFYYCSEKNCNGKMNFTGKVFLTYPEKYEHVCEKCNIIKGFPNVTGFIKYE